MEDQSLFYGDGFSPQLELLAWPALWESLSGPSTFMLYVTLYRLLFFDIVPLGQEQKQALGRPVLLK